MGPSYGSLSNIFVFFAACGQATIEPENDLLKDLNILMYDTHEKDPEPIFGNYT
jgi:hypothetical protein